MAKAKAAAKKAGRPTKYSEDILAATLKYVDGAEDRFSTFTKSYSATGESFERLVEAGLPTVEGLALELHVHRDTIQEWRKEHKPFSVALELLDQKQRQMLIKGGLSGYYNPLITKLVLSANHGMKEKTDVTTDDKPLPQPIINVHRDHSDEAH
jgi:hypothetical protein